MAVLASLLKVNISSAATSCEDKGLHKNIFLRQNKLFMKEYSISAQHFEHSLLMSLLMKVDRECVVWLQMFKVTNKCSDI